VQSGQSFRRLAIRLLGFGIDGHGIFASMPSRSLAQSNDMTVVWMAVIAYGASFVIPFGLPAFCLALECLTRCVMDPTSLYVLDWLLALSWIANPGVWAGFFFLFRRAYGRAAVVGEVAVVLAVCAAGNGWLMPAYHLWLTSMLLVVYAALRLPRWNEASSESPRVDTARRMSATPRLIFYPAIGLPLVLGTVLVLLAHWGVYGPSDDFPGFEPNKHVHVGEDAKAEILRWAGTGLGVGTHGARLPASASDLWLYHDGGFGGSISYCTFRCGDRADCEAAVEYLVGAHAKDLQRWKPSRYAVVMEGPEFYSRTLRPKEKLRSNPWNLREIRNGLVYEYMRGDHDSLIYCAVDLDTDRVYFVDLSGGFPGAEYRPADDGGDFPTKSD
jgi:hypothetical protein